jgi:hypothetical protein
MELMVACRFLCVVVVVWRGGVRARLGRRRGGILEEGEEMVSRRMGERFGVVKAEVLEGWEEGEGREGAGVDHRTYEEKKGRLTGKEDQS